MLYLSDNQLSGTLTPYVLPDGLQVSSQSPADLGARRAHRVPRRRPCTGSACRQGPYTGPEGSPRHTGRCGRQGFGWPACRPPSGSGLQGDPPRPCCRTCWSRATASRARCQLGCPGGWRASTWQGTRSARVLGAGRGASRPIAGWGKGRPGATWGARRRAAGGRRPEPALAQRRPRSMKHRAIAQ